MTLFELLRAGRVTPPQNPIEMKNCSKRQAVATRKRLPLIGALLVLVTMPAAQKSTIADEDASVAAIDLATANQTTTQDDPHLLHRKGSSRWRHQLTLHKAAWSSDGNLIATSEQDGDIRLWNAKSGQVIRTISPGHRISVRGMEFSPDGSQLAYLTEDGELWRFDLKTEKPGHKATLRLPDEAGTSGGLAWSPDGVWLTVKFNGKLTGFKNNGNDQQFSVDSPAGTTHAPICWSPDGTLLAVTQGNSILIDHAEQFFAATKPADAVAASSVLIEAAHDAHIVAAEFALRNGQTVLVTTGRGALRTVEFLRPNGRSVTSATGETKVWDISTGELLTTFAPNAYDNGATAMTVLPGRERIAVATVDHIRIWNLSTESEELTIGGEGSLYNENNETWQHCLTISPDGSLLAAPASGQRLGFWRLTDGEIVPDVDGIHSAAVSIVEASRDGRTIASASGDGVIRIWNGTDFSEKCSVTMFNSDNTRGELSVLALSGNGEYFAAGNGSRVHRGGPNDGLSFEGTIRIWDVETNPSLTLIDIDAIPGKLLFSEDAGVLAVATNNQAGLFAGIRRSGDASEKPDPELNRERILLIDRETKEVFKSLDGHLGTIAGLQFDNSGTELVSVGTDSVLRRWDTDSGRELSSHPLPMDHPHRVVFADSSRVLALNAMFGEAAWVSKADGSAINKVELGNCKGAHLALSPDGKILCAAGQILTRTTAEFDESAQLFDARSGKNLATIPTKDGSATAITFTDEGRKLIVGTGRGVVQVWDVAGLLRPEK